MFYLLYETKNKINGKIYRGVHQTQNINDGYMGSGRILKTAIEKYGINNFEKTILETFSSSYEMYKREKELIDNEFVSRPDTYNLCVGGKGGFDFINRNELPKFKGKAHNLETKTKISEAHKGRELTIEHKNLLSVKSWAKNNPEEQRAHAVKISSGRIKSDDERLKISLTLKGKMKGVTKPRVVCPYCGHEGGKNVMNRWHFKNCKTRGVSGERLAFQADTEEFEPPAPLQIN